LRDTKEHLQSTIEEYETALEELKSSNEELVSVNEEAQSTNEELEASKEELQSLNEELNTINVELNSKVEELDQANNDLRNLFESTQIATVFLDGSLVIRNFTPAASTFFKLRPADVGRPLTELAGYLEYPELKDHIRKVFDSGEAIEHRIARGEGEAYHLVRLIPYRGDLGRIEGVVVTFIDITSLARAEEHQKVLISELNHRVKNMLAVVISLITQTMEQTSTKEAFGEVIIGRIRAMARAYGTLSRQNWKAVPIEDIVRQELEPFGLDRVAIVGPAIELPPQAGLSIGLVLHELSTNAAKYGALSSADGQVRVEWAEPDKTKLLRLQWTEHDGPRVVAPKASGFGLNLIRGEIEYRFGGTLQADFAPDGLKVSISFPLKTET
jgi:two-component system CheB/CheR fusion protein